MASVARIIADATAVEDLAECSLDAFQAMERLSLEKKLRATMEDNHIDPSGLKVAVDTDAGVTITGIAVSETDKEGLIRMLDKMAGVASYEIDVIVWPRAAQR